MSSWIKETRALHDKRRDPGWARGKSGMKKSTLLKPLMLVAALAYTPALLADNIGLYVGVGLGQPKTTIEDLTSDNLHVPDVFTGAPQPASSSTNNASSTTWMAYGGYELNHYLAIEGLYIPLGEYNRDFVSKFVRVDVLKPAPGFSIIGQGTFETADKLTLDGFGLAGVVKAPFTIRWGVFGKFGIFRWRGQLTGSTIFYRNLSANPNPLAYEEKDSGYSPILGLGAYYNLLHRITLRAEWMRINNVGGSLSTGSSEVNTFMLGTQVNF